MFTGFLPVKAAALRSALQELAGVNATLIAYEAPSRVGDTLAAMAAVLGDREAALCRELTKMFETAHKGRCFRNWLSCSRTRHHVGSVSW